MISSAAAVGQQVAISPRDGQAPCRLTIEDLSLILQQTLLRGRDAMGFDAAASKERRVKVVLFCGGQLQNSSTKRKLYGLSIAAEFTQNSLAVFYFGQKCYFTEKIFNLKKLPTDCSLKG